MSTKKTDPDERELNPIQARRLASLTGLPSSEFEGHTIAALSERLRWVVDPNLWLWRRVCGQVVQTDPTTGVAYPVPNATVEVFDTVCDYWGFFPDPWPWGWLFPVRCERELIATTCTDPCGNFCFWVPAFEIEWILGWREERICFPELFIKPSVGDLVAGLSAQTIPSDPAGLVARLRPGGDLATTLGPRAGRLLNAARNSTGFGDDVGPIANLLRAPAFTAPVTPPLPSLAASEDNAVTTGPLTEIDPGQFFGPFLRCVDVIVPEWYPIFEVPDVSISVTQEIAGTSQTIYNGAFDISWGTNPIPPVTLQASQIAIATQGPCPPPQVNSEDFGFQYVGLLPVSAPYALGGTFQGTTGFATRVNQYEPFIPNPSPPPATIQVSGTCDQTDLTVPPSYPATAPFFGELGLYGSTGAPGTATYYRIQAQYAPGSGIPTPTPASFGPQVTLTPSWVVPTTPSVTMSPDSEGWYAVPTDETGWGSYTDMLLPWDTGDGSWADGVYQLTLEISDTTPPTTPPSGTAQLMLVVDNTPPQSPQLVINWQPNPSSPPDPTLWQPAFPAPPGDCALIHTGGQPIALQFIASATSPHLRSASVSVGGCGGAAPTPAATNPPDYQWYSGSTDPSATSFKFTGVYTLTLGPDTPAGCYGFTLYADTRAFNSAGGESNDPVTNGWCVNELDPPYIEPQASLAIVF